MRNEDIKWKVQTIVNLIDGWLEDISNEEEPECDLSDAGVDVRYAYQAGAYKARAEINARKLERTRDWLLNEFEKIGVQSRVKRI